MMKLTQKQQKDTLEAHLFFFNPLSVKLSQNGFGEQSDFHLLLPSILAPSSKPEIKILFHRQQA